MYTYREAPDDSSSTPTTTQLDASYAQQASSPPESDPDPESSSPPESDPDPESSSPPESDPDPESVGALSRKILLLLLAFCSILLLLVNLSVPNDLRCKQDQYINSYGQCTDCPWVNVCDGYKAVFNPVPDIVAAASFSLKHLPIAIQVFHTGSRRIGGFYKVGRKIVPVATSITKPTPA